MIATKTTKVSLKNLRFFRKSILKWIAKNKRIFAWRRKGLSVYQVMISEALLQRTKAETVQAFYPVFLERYKSWGELAAEPRTALEKFLKPIGLSKQKSVLLHSLAIEMCWSANLKTATREKLESLPGVGQYIASAILCICQKRREPLLDVNMARVLERYFGPRKLADIRYDPYLQHLARAVLPRKAVKEFNWAILDFAALVCSVRSPKCQTCALHKKCLYKLKVSPFRATRRKHD